MIYWLVWEKYDDLLRKNPNIRGRLWKKGEKRKFSVYLGKKYHFGKRGGGISIIWIIYTPALKFQNKFYSSKVV